MRLRGSRVVAMFLITGCPDERAGTTASADTQGSTSTNAETSSGQGEPTPAEDSSGGASPATSTTGSPTDSTEGSSGAPDGTTAIDASDTTTGGEVPGLMICQPSCTEPADCCPEPKGLPPGVSCPDDYPYNFVCPDGVCRPGGCTSDAQCPPGRECLEHSGIALCRTPCDANEDCTTAPPFGACTGVATDGTTYCDYEFGCNPGDDCLGLGVCLDGVCGCRSDADCGEDAGCTPDW